MTDGHPPHDRELGQLADAKSSIRARACKRYLEEIGSSFEKLTEMPAVEVARLVRELQIHQIELEMQNEELLDAQNALEASRSRFRELYDRSPVGYCQVVGTEGLIEDANATLAEMLGQDSASLNGQRFSSLIENSHQDEFYHLKRRMQSSLQADSCELQLKRCDGSLVWVQLSATIAAVDASILRLSVLMIDARIRAEADRALLESQLRESQKMEAVGTLASGIAHDFNNILTVMVVNADVAIRLIADTVPLATNSIKEIQKAAARARELVRQILAFCRHEPIGLHAISLAATIEESIGLLRSTIPSRFDLQFTCDERVPDVLADSTQIEQVIINLASNSMQAMEGKAGRLSIHLDSLKLDADSIRTLNLHGPHWCDCDRVVRLTFTDNGPGIAPNVVGRIFEPFFTTKPANAGTGLGLAVVHGIIQSHEGQVTVATKLGEGTTFTIYLPPAERANAVGVSSDNVDSLVVDSSGLAQSCAPSEGNKGKLKDCRILYVDDDQSVLKSIILLLKSHGIVVSGYSDPVAVLDVLRDESADYKILVTDYNMPGLSGLEFAMQVRKLRPELPVVIISGFIDDELTAHAREAGVTALMEKPFSTKHFLELLSQAIL